MEEEVESNFSREEEYIRGESQEISVGESPYSANVFKLFPAFKNKNYRVYFSGQLISLIGTWLQTVAEGWLVLQLTNSAFMVGVVTALANLPMLLFSLFGGVLVDRLSKKKILICTQAASMILAIVLGISTILHIITVWEIAIMAFLLGTVNALDFPARQSYISELVETAELPSAIALNSGTFNAARVIGPAVAGMLIVIVGTGGAYVLNGLSYVATIFTLNLTRPKLAERRTHLHPFKAIKQGLSYSFKHNDIRTLMIFVSVVSVFGWSYMTIMSVLAQNTFHVGATGLGYLYMAGGLGALISTVIVSAFASKVSPVLLILSGNLIFAVSLILFSFTNNFIFGLILLFLTGLGLLMAFPTINTTLQRIVPNEIRGRVMSIYTLMFIGLFPLGNFEIGWLSEKFGTSVALRFDGTVVLFAVIIVFVFKNKLLRLESLRK